MSRLLEEASRRRTFAIISHPDAGKTTLTEKFLLYAGAIAMAGSVKDRKAERTARSDWLELEQKRGISVSSAVMRFDHKGHVFNLLDTPGHRDFSEDTYRVLSGVDAAVMVLDAARGVEPQTLKLFEVCRRRGTPLITFVNKMDRPAPDTRCASSATSSASSTDVPTTSSTGSSTPTGRARRTIAPPRSRRSPRRRPT